MFKTIAALVPRDKDLPLRAWTLTVRNEFLDDTIYDRFGYEFHQERDENGDGSYIPIAKRAPSVRCGLLGTVVSDSVSFLFAEGRFPQIDAGGDTASAETIEAIIKDCHLNDLMIEAATRGSIGSVCVLLRVLAKRLFFEALPTAYLTPKFQPLAPDTLESVQEKYKVKGLSLREAGYVIADDDTADDFWFQREWTETAETWYFPRKCSDKNAPLVVDTAPGRTISHGLGFVPMVWIRNLPGGDQIDGGCTFKAAIENSIEINYQLSQGGRGLKYSSSPTLCLSTDDPDPSGKRVVGDALIVPTSGDAKLLEIDGGATQAVIEYTGALRKIALEATGGSRADSDKLSAATSGRAMELMNQSLINLADKLRSSYGEGGLLRLLKMIAYASNKFALVDSDAQSISPIAPNTKIGLIWPKWYAPTADDRQADAGALSVLKTAGLISTETAVKSIADDYDIEGVDGELSAIKSEQAEDQAAQLALKAAAPVPAPQK